MHYQRPSRTPLSWKWVDLHSSGADSIALYPEFNLVLLGEGENGTTIKTYREKTVHRVRIKVERGAEVVWWLRLAFSNNCVCTMSDHWVGKWSMQAKRSSSSSSMSIWYVLLHSSCCCTAELYFFTLSDSVKVMNHLIYDWGRHCQVHSLSKRPNTNCPLLLTRATLLQSGAPISTFSVKVGLLYWDRKNRIWASKILSNER